MPLDTGGSLFWKTRIDTKGVAAGAAKTKGILAGLAGSISKMDVFAALAVGAVLTFKKIVKNAYKMSLDFNHAMTEVMTISDEVKKNFEGVSDAVMDLSTIVPDTAIGLTKALYQIVSAGYDGAKGMEVLRESAKLATASVTDTFTAADAVTSIMNAYGEAAGSVENISDKLFTTVKLGKTKMEELGPAITTITGMSAQAGLAFDDLMAIIAKGVKTLKTPIMMTGLRGILTALTKQQDETAEKAKQLGIEFDITALKTKGFSGFLKDVMDATDGNIKVLAKLFPNIRGLSGILAVATEAGGDFDSVLNEMKNSTGATSEAFEIMVNDTTNQLKILKNNVTKKMKPLGDFMVSTMNTVAKSINKIFEDAKKQVDDFGRIEVKYKNLEKRYVELKKKVKLTTDEHKELKDVIQSLAEIVPGAVTAYDEYGKAIDVNITKMRSLIDLQRQQARIAERKWLKEQIKNFENLSQKIVDTNNALSRARKRNEEAIENYVIFSNTQQKIIQQLDRIKQRYKNGEISLSDYNKQVDYHNDLLRKKGVPIQNEYANSYKNLSKVNKESSEKLSLYRFQLDLLVNELSGFIDLTKTPKIVQFQLRQIGVDLTLNKIKEIQKIYGEIASHPDEGLKETPEPSGPIKIEGITVKGVKPISLYDESDFQELFSKLETMKSLGLNVSEELTDAWDNYIEFVKAKSGEESDAYRIAVEQKKQAEKQFLDWKRQSWQDEHEWEMLALNTMVAGYDTFVNTILDKEMTGKERREAMWDSMKQYFVSTLADMLKEKAINIATDLAMEEGKAAKELAIQAGAMVKSVAITMAGELKKIAIKIASITAGIFEFYSFLGPFAYPATAVTMAGIIGLIRNAATMKFEKGTSGRGFIVPPGYEHDKFPIMVSSGELVNVIPKSDVNKLLKDIPTIPAFPQIPSTTIQMGDYAISMKNMAREIRDLKNMIANRQTSLVINNQVVGKFSQRDLAFIFEKGQEYVRTHNL